MRADVRFFALDMMCFTFRAEVKIFACEMT
jgi:hypothetical protein